VAELLLNAGVSDAKAQAPGQLTPGLLSLGALGISGLPIFTHPSPGGGGQH